MLLKTIQDVKEKVPVIGTMKFENFTPFIKQAERNYIKPYIGEALYNQIESAYQATTIAPPSTKLLDKCQEAIVMYMLYLWFPTGQISIGDNGVRISTTETLKTAFQWQIDDAKTSVLNAAGSAMDELVDYLMANRSEADFAPWLSSDAYARIKACMIDTTKRFTELYGPLGNLWTNFVAIRSQMIKTQELIILPAIGKPLYTQLLSEHKMNNMSPANTLVFERIQKALAPLTMERAITELSATIDKNGILIFNNSSSSQVLNSKEPAKDAMISKLEMSAANDGAAYLQALKDFLFENIADYPLYSNSTAYDSTTTNTAYQNEPDTNNFGML